MKSTSTRDAPFSSPSGTPGQRLAKGVAITVVGVVLLKGIRFLLVPLYTRFLTPEDYGIIGVLMPLILFLSMMAQMGQGASISFFMFEEREEPARFRKTLSTIFANMFVASLVIAGLFLLFGGSLFKIFFPVNPEIFTTYRYLVAGLLLIYPAQQVVMILLQAREARVRIALINLGIFLLTFSLMLYQLVLRKSGAFGQILATLESNAFLVIPFLIVLFLILGKRFSYSLPAAKRTLAYGIPLLPHAASLWALNLSDRFLISRYAGLQEAGFYTFAYTCGMAMQFVVTSMQQVWGPVFFDVRRNDPRGRDLLGELATKWSLFLCVVAGVGILFTPEIVRIIASRRYWVAIPYIIPVILGYLFNGLYTFPGLILQQMKKNALLSLCTITAASANIISNLIFIPRYGAIAAAWNTAATFALMALLYYIVGMKLNPINIRWKTWLGSLVLVGGAFLLSRLPLSLPMEAIKALYTVMMVGLLLRNVGGVKRLFSRAVEGS